MSMICSLLRVDDDLAERLHREQELVRGVCGLAYKRHLDEAFLHAIHHLSPSEQQQRLERRAQREIETLERIPPRLAEQVAQELALRDRAATLRFDAAISLEKSWDAFERLFRLAGGSLFSGEMIGPDLGYGPAFFLRPTPTQAFAAFLAGPGATQVRDADMVWLREQRPYAWPEPGEDSTSDEELSHDLAQHFDILRSYVAEAAQVGDGLLIWIH